MSDDLVKQSLLELQDLVSCRCCPAYTGRGLHDPDCDCDSADAVKVVADRIEELEAKLANAMEALKDVIGMLDDPHGWEHVRDMRGATLIARKSLAELSSVSCANLKGQDE